MAKGKKTVPVSRMMEMANNFFKNSKDEESDKRLGVASFLDGILCEADRYEGYDYLTQEDMKDSLFGKSFGVEYGLEHSAVIHDTSRRKYRNSIK